MKMIFNTIRGKLVLSFLILVLFLVSFFILYAYNRENQAIRSETVKRGQAVSLTFAQMVSTYIYELDYITILDNARELTTEGDIQTVSVAEPDGTLLIDTRGRHGEKLPPDPFYEEAIEKKSPQYRELTSIMEPTTEFITPIVSLNVTDYLLIIRISQKNAHERLNRATMKIMLISLIMVILAAFIVLILTNVLASPIKRLVKGTREIARGHLDCQIELNGTEEISELARSFNLMGRNLKRQVEHLRRAEKKYRDIFENAVEGLFQITPNGYFISTNVSLAEIIGYESPEELMAGQGSFFRCHADPEAPERLKKMLLKKGRVFGFESRLVRTDGRKTDVSISARAVNDGKGRLQYLEGSVMDITESRERKETQRSLEAADTANRIKNEFMARISHELRTPMNAILGFTDLLTKELLKPEQERYIRQIDISARKLMDIIDDILDFSEIEAGKMKLESVSFSIADVMERIRRQFADEATDRGLRLRMEMDEQTPQLFRGDPSRLGQILSNLMSNAVKFTEKGEIVLSVQTVKKTGTGALLRFSVRDTGIGIFPKKMEFLFQPFTQAEDSLTRRYGGSGLGLVICKKLAEMMGGEIAVESAPGKGSVFSFINFFETVPRDRAFCPPPEAPSAGQEAVNPQPVRVLIADDNPINLQVAEAMLSKLNVETKACRNGAEVLAAFDAETWDVILMDVRMPGMDGYETARCIRDREAEKESGKKRIPIVAISGQSLPDQNEKCLEVGMDDFLNKPFSPNQLTACLKKWVPSISLKKAGASGPEIRQESPLPPELPGIEIESALERLEGKQNLFRKLLVDFKGDFSDTAEEISSALKNEAFEDAVRAAHSIKGVAANIGAEKLSETAAVLEKCFKEKQTDISGPFAAFQEALKQVLAAADLISDPASGPPEKKTDALPEAAFADRERLRPMLEQLAVLLDEGNADTAAHWDETRLLIHPAKAGREISVIERQISDFEYEEALKTLKEIARLLGVPLKSDSG